MVNKVYFYIIARILADCAYLHEICKKLLVYYIQMQRGESREISPPYS